MIFCEDSPECLSQSGCVAICLAAYNGEEFIAQQMDSILRQTYSDWVLFVRDDGSSDGTRSIVDDYIARYPHKIVLVEDQDEGHGCSCNFLATLRRAVRDSFFSFFMFCDQDDVWDDDKVELEVAEVTKLQMQFGDKNPALVITDCRVVDENLQVITSRLSVIRPFNPDGITLAQSLINNVGQGATMLMNRPLAEELLTSKLDDNEWMYDWWTMILALCFGSVSYIDRPTMSYRQHSSNAVGAGNYHRSIVDGITHLFKEPQILHGWLDRLVSDERAYSRRARSVLNQFEERLEVSDREMMDGMARFNDVGRFARLGIMLRYNLWRQNTFYEKIYQFWSIVLAKRTND